MDEKTRLVNAIERFDLESYMHVNFEKIIPAGSDELRVDCFSPKGCDGSDTKAHLYVNFDKKVWNCFKCGYGSTKIQKGSANLVRFIADAEGIPYYEAKERLLNQSTVAEEGNLEKLLEQAFEPKEAIPIQEKKIDLPSQFYPLWNSKALTAKRFKQYVNTRRFDSIAQQQFDVRYCVTPVPSLPNKLQRNFINRLIWPIYDQKGICRSVVARSIDSNAQSRYINWPGTDLSHYLWPLISIQNGKFYPTQLSDSVVLTEGIVDAYAINQLTSFSALACFGKKISDHQIELLKKLNIRKVILAWDHEAREKTKRTTEQLLPHFSKVQVFPFKHPGWFRYDFGDALRSFTLRSIISNECQSSIDVLTPAFCAWGL